MLVRRAFLAGAASSLVLPTSWAGNEFPSYTEVPFGKFPGDYGYLHDKYHRYYEIVFGEILECACGAGDCRVTYWRQTKMGSPHGYDIVLLRRWEPLPAEARMPKPEEIPPQLLTEWAHVCVYNENYEPVSIPCVIINKANT